MQILDNITTTGHERQKQVLKRKNLMRRQMRSIIDDDRRRIPLDEIAKKRVVCLGANFNHKAV